MTREGTSHTTRIWERNKVSRLLFDRVMISRCLLEQLSTLAVPGRQTGNEERGGPVYDDNVIDLGKGSRVILLQPADNISRIIDIVPFFMTPLIFPFLFRYKGSTVGSVCILCAVSSY